MRTRYTCALDGAQLHDVAPEILITDVAYGPIQRQIALASPGGGHGQRVLGDRTRALRVTVSMEIHTMDVARRMAVCQLAARWALAGGYLTTGDRPGQRLFVLCDAPPVIASALRWTQRVTIGFMAAAHPFWEDAAPLSVALSGSASRQITAPGYAAPARVAGRVVNTGASALSTLILIAGDTAIRMEGLGLAPGRALTFGTDERGVFFLRADGVSALDKRTAASSDALLLPAGTLCALGVQASGAVQTTFEVRGCYL